MTTRRARRTFCMALIATAALTGLARAAPTDAPKDHWKGVRFDAGRFEQVRRYVAQYYIDGHADEAQGWAGAANGALGRLRPRLELLPRAWYARQVEQEEDKWRLSGPTWPFHCEGGARNDLLVHRLPERTAAQRAALRADDKAWRRANDRARGRHDELRKAWAAMHISRAEMACAMALAQHRLHAPPAASPEAQVVASGAAVTETEVDPDLPPSEAAPPDIDRLWLAATNGYLQALDPHSAVIAKSAWDEATARTQDASFEGIGAVMTWKEGRTRVENPMRGMPAHKAGLRAGDEVVSVDGKSVVGMALSQVVALIRGPRGTSVRLEVARTGVTGTVTITVVRSRVEMKNVSGELLPEHPGLAVVRMTGFVPQSTLDLRAMILKLRRQRPDKTLKGLILDLRGNGGGLLDKAIELSDMFLDHGRIVSIRNRQGLANAADEEIHDARKQPGWDLALPLVVLLDDSSASASEILAAALQDNGRALVTGLRSFGKGSVQRLFDPPLQRDYYLKLTVARYHSPSGRAIQLGGVVPDVELPPEAGGPIPPGFREEDLAGHMAAVAPATPGPLAGVVPALHLCVTRSGVAQRVVEGQRGGAVKPDFQLLRSADYLQCLARLQHGR